MIFKIFFHKYSILLSFSKFSSFKNSSIHKRGSFNFENCIFYFIISGISFKSELIFFNKESIPITILLAYIEFI